MLLHELLVIVSGYPSSIDPNQLNHPSEREIFIKANEFSTKVAHVSSHCFNHAGPIIPIVEAVLNEYLAEVLVLEGKVDEIDMSTIMADTVDKWHKTIDYCGELVSSQKYVSTGIALQLRKDVFSGFPQISRVAQSCLAAVDEYFIKEITPCLLWGYLPKIEIEYPGFDGPVEAIKNIGECLRNVRLLHVNAEFTGFTEFAQRANEAIRTLSYPLDELQLKKVLGTIQNNINVSLLPHVMAQSQVHELVVILRNIVLCGSSMFCMCFAENLQRRKFHELDSDIFERAITQYQEDTREITPECCDLAVDMLTLVETIANDDAAADGDNAPSFGGILCKDSETSVEVEFRLCRRFSLFISSTHGDVYGDIFYYLLCIWVVNDALKGYSLRSQRYKLFFNALWLWFQNNINSVISKLELLFSGEVVSLDNIISSHTQILRDLGRKLLLNNRAYRMCMKRILDDAVAVILYNESQVAATDESIGDPINELVSYISKVDDFTELHVQLLSLVK